jgi:transposase
MTMDGSIDAARFLDYVRRILVPTLKPGDTVIVDNLSSHKSDEVREAIEAVGAKVLFLPPYSPDFNPIEKAFAKLKALLRRAAARTVEAVRQAIEELVPIITPTECANFFAACGYDQN